MINLATYCPKGSTLYYSLLYKTAVERQAIIAIEAFYQEIFRAITDYSDVALARIKLQWWREQVEKVNSANQDHPIAKALADTNKLYLLEKSLLYDIINGFETYLDHPLFETQNDLIEFFRKTAAIREQLILKITSVITNSADYSLILASGFEVVFHLINLTFYRKKGHFFFPQQDLDKANCSIEEIATGKTTPAINKFLSNQANFAKQYLKMALASLNKFELLAQSQSVIRANIYINLLYEMEKSNFNILEKPIDLTPLRKFWIAWRTYRNLKVSSTA